MRVLPLLVGLSLACGPWPPPVAYGQATAATGAGAADASDGHRVSVVPIIGSARRSSTGDWLGMAPDRDLLFVAVHVEIPIASYRGVTLVANPAALPVVRLTHTARSVDLDPPQPAALGAGLAPVALALRFPLPLGVRGFTDAAGGALWFDRVVPVPRASAVNWMAQWGGGVDLPGGPIGALRIGYRFLHISNGHTADRNPGVDNHVVYAGVRWRLRSGRAIRAGED